ISFRCYTSEIGVLQIGTRAMVIENKSDVSSPNHPTTDVKDAFSSNFLDYTIASQNYIPASLGNISPDPPDNLSKYLFASLAISHFHDMQAYNVVANKPPIPPQDLITPPTILTLSPVLPPSLLFDPRYFFVPEELLPPKKQIHTPLYFSTMLSNSSRKYHFIKEQVEQGVIELYFVNTEYQLADLFTKALGRERIEFLTNKLGMRSFTPETLQKLMNEDDE
nr:retrovirus-related Pol polyprotein from transposon TNT 1-94 [Tanacetum cinerariifolium]